MSLETEPLANEIHASDVPVVVPSCEPRALDRVWIWGVPLGVSADFGRRRLRKRVDAHGETADHQEAGRGEIPAEQCGHLLSVHGWGTRADDRDGGPHGQGLHPAFELVLVALMTHEEAERRIGKVSEARRIELVVPGDDGVTPAVFLEGRKQLLWRLVKDGVKGIA